MLSYVIAGLVLGGIYAISAGGIVVTYVSTGVLNLAFGTVAHFLARLYYFLLIQHHWSVPEAAAFVLLCASPALGVLLYFVLFRFIVHQTLPWKVVQHSLVKTRRPDLLRDPGRQVLHRHHI